MIKLAKLMIPMVALGVLGACQTANSGSSGGNQGMPSKAEQACLRAVTEMSNNPDVVLLRSNPQGSGTNVIVGVGEERAQWNCLGFSDGATSDVYFMN